MLFLLAPALAAAPMLSAPALPLPAQACTSTTASVATTRSMALGTDTLFVGYSLVNNQQGRVRVFDIAGDGEITPTLWIDRPASQSSYRWFGRAIAADGDRMVVTCPSDNLVPSISGSAYAYARMPNGDWVFEDSLLAPWPDSSNRFGNSATMEGDWLFIGEHTIDTQFAPGGRIHVYRRSGTTWVQTQVLTDTRKGFGYAMDIEGGRLLVGSFFGTGSAAEGGAFLYEETGGVWSRTESFPPLSGPEFGRDVAIEGNLAVVGASGHDGVPGQRGAAAVFEQDASGAWNLVDELRAAPGTAGSVTRNHGRWVDISNGMVAVGARRPGLSATVVSYGIEVYGRVCGVWQRARIYGAPNGGLPGDATTQDLILSDGHLIAAYETLLVSREIHCTLGSVECAPNMQNTTRTTATMRALGSPIVATDNLRLRMDSLPANSAGLVLLSETMDVTPFQSCTAELCLGGTIARGSSSPLVANTQGRAFYTLDLQSLPPVLGGGPIQAGETWFFQYWYRNPSALKPVGLSNAVAVTFE